MANLNPIWRTSARSKPSTIQSRNKLTGFEHYPTYPTPSGREVHNPFSPAKEVVRKQTEIEKKIK